MCGFITPWSRMNSLSKMEPTLSGVLTSSITTGLPCSDEHVNASATTSTRPKIHVINSSDFVSSNDMVPRGDIVPGNNIEFNHYLVTSSHIVFSCN